MEPIEMQQRARQMSGLMKALSNEGRFMVLCQLMTRERSVGELMRLIGMRQAALSQQLALLRKDGLVRARREAQTVYYSLAREDVREIMDFLYDTYCIRQQSALPSPSAPSPSAPSPSVTSPSVTSPSVTRAEGIRAT
jgi:DNA-binding transcriptional ArsR family regulator